MKAIILSAGKGTRLKKIRKDIPKVLMPIWGKPMIEWNIDLLKDYGINRIAINTHHLGNQITKRLGDGSRLGVEIRYSYEKELLGTAGSLINFKDFLNETFVVIYGDVISKLNLEKLMEYHRERKSKATLVVHNSDHPEDSDIVEVLKDWRIKKLHHKPGNIKYGTLGSAALYICEPEVINYVTKNTLPCDFIKDIFPKMLKDNQRLYAYMTEEFIKDAGTPKRLKEVKNHLREYLL